MRHWGMGYVLSMRHNAGVSMIASGRLRLSVATMLNGGGFGMNSWHIIPPVGAVEKKL